jgi:hypothetical protein
MAFLFNIIVSLVVDALVSLIVGALVSAYESSQSVLHR